MKRNFFRKDPFLWAEVGFCAFLGCLIGGFSFLIGSKLFFFLGNNMAILFVSIFLGMIGLAVVAFRETRRALYDFDLVALENERFFDRELSKELAKSYLIEQKRIVDFTLIIGFFVLITEILLFDELIFAFAGTKFWNYFLGTLFIGFFLVVVVSVLTPVTTERICLGKKGTYRLSLLADQV